MPNKTNIGWCDYSSNPLRARRKDGKQGHACVKISPGCAHCYSEAINNRFGTGLDYTARNIKDVETYLDDKELQRILKFKPRGPFKGGRERAAVFVFDMTDVFGEWVPDETINHLFATFALNPSVDFLVLTKRAERMAKWASWHPAESFTVGSYIQEELDARGWSTGACAARMGGNVHVNELTLDLHVACGDSDFGGYMGEETAKGLERAFGSSAETWLRLDRAWHIHRRWPIPNVWLGVSVENQEQADARIPFLLKTPAAVRFLSCEPLLGPIDLRQVRARDGWSVDCLCGEWEKFHDGGFEEQSGTECHAGGPSVSWIISGCESGPKRRPCNEAWVRSISEQCESAGVAYFNKQMEINGKVSTDPTEFPSGLQVQQFPSVVVKS